MADSLTKPRSAGDTESDLCSLTTTIDNPTKTRLYDQIIPFVYSRMLVNRSDLDVSRSVPTHFCRGWVLVRRGLFVLLAG